MSKQELLARVHALLWRNDDLMFQETMEELQLLVRAEIIAEVSEGRMKAKCLDNGFICNINGKHWAAYDKKGNPCD